MAGLPDELCTLAGMKRTHANFELIRDQVAELREQAGNAETALTALKTAHDALAELREALDETGDDNSFVQWSVDVREKLDEFADFLPGDDETDIGDLVSEAETAAESYEEIMDDREYGADAREEAWGELCDALTNIANALTVTVTDPEVPA